MLGGANKNTANIMVKGYLIIAMRLKLFLKLLLRHGVGLHPRYLLCLLFLLQCSFWSSFLSFREKLIYGRKLKNTPVPRNPIFIIGHWRTGSTLLHQLLNCDPQLTAPNQLQCTYPESFISGRKFIAPVMGFMLPDKRPMDNVKEGLWEPQEDEFALFRLCGFSPVERLLFPHSGAFFLNGDDRFLPPQKELHKWECAIKQFAAKLYFHTGKRIVFKNPFHSLRIPVLRKLFPEASFIHIYRNPLTVIPSTKHMWTIVGKENALRKEWKPPEFEEVVDCYNNVTTHIHEDLKSLPREKYHEICFENLEKNPVTIIKKTYNHFKMDFPDTFEEKMRTFMKSIEGYKKNKYELSKEQEELISDRLQHHMKRDGYIKN